MFSVSKSAESKLSLKISEVTWLGSAVGMEKSDP